MDYLHIIEDKEIFYTFFNCYEENFFWHQKINTNVSLILIDNQLYNIKKDKLIEEYFFHYKRPSALSKNLFMNILSKNNFYPQTLIIFE